ncbi:ATP synthase regulation protein NCA2-domain-containing protein [Tribonema minus]|uniref:ATP synthase regulation protein NCA2-domain-containing protein n=1 Tax=Tribonema minus TaxID=303371 RepID=A0A835Z2D9_9STRA|nr:ATP synthase regulation protein NCA2-domain-containing protein [Tribonema minus]
MISAGRSTALLALLLLSAVDATSPRAQAQVARRSQRKAPGLHGQARVRSLQAQGSCRHSGCRRQQRRHALAFISRAAIQDFCNFSQQLSAPEPEQLHESDGKDTISRKHGNGGESGRRTVRDLPSVAANRAVRFSKFWLYAGLGVLRWARRRALEKAAVVLIVLASAKQARKAAQVIRKRVVIRTDDKYVDAADADYVQRGTIMEAECFALTRALETVKASHTAFVLCHRIPWHVASHSSVHHNADSELMHYAAAAEEWTSLLRAAQAAAGVRCAPSKRTAYVHTLSSELAALRRTLSTMTVLRKGGGDGGGDGDHGGEESGAGGGQFDFGVGAAVVDQIELVASVRLADAQLRVVRDALLATARDLRALLLYWRERCQHDRGMGRVQSALVSIVRRKQGMGGRELVMRTNRERVAALELLLAKHMDALGNVQCTLLSRPQVSLAALSSAGDKPALLPGGVCTALEQWSWSALRMLDTVLTNEGGWQHHLRTNSTETPPTEPAQPAAHALHEQPLRPPQQQRGHARNAGGHAAHDGSAQSPEAAAVLVAAVAVQEIHTVSVSTVQGSLGGAQDTAGGTDDYVVSDAVLAAFARTAAQRGLTDATAAVTEPLTRSAQEAEAAEPEAPASSGDVDRPSGSSKARGFGGLVRQFVAGIGGDGAVNLLGLGGGDKTTTRADGADAVTDDEHETMASAIDEAEHERIAPDSSSISSTSKTEHAAPADGTSSKKKHKGSKTTGGEGLHGRSRQQLEQMLIQRADKAVFLQKTQKRRLARMVTEAHAQRPVRTPFIRYGVMAIGLETARRYGMFSAETREAAVATAQQAKAGIHNFFNDQLVAPVTAIVNGVLFRRRQALTEEGAMEDAKTSLQNLLRDFLKDMQPKVPEQEREQQASQMDMTPITRRFEKEASRALRGIIAGPLLRVLLIQIAHLKLQGLSAMEAIDDLYNANQLNLQLLASLPALIVVAGTYFVARNVFFAIMSRRLEPTAIVHAGMRGALREVERALTNSSAFSRQAQPLILREAVDGPDDGGAGSDIGGGDTFVVAGAGQDRIGGIDRDTTSILGLSAGGCGALVLQVHLFQQLLQQNASRFDARTRRGVEEDLRDLLAHGITVTQQLAVVRRMQRTYPFLQYTRESTGLSYRLGRHLRLVG